MLNFTYILATYSAVAIGLALFFVYESCVNNYTEAIRYQKHAETLGRKSPARYLVNSPSCKIPNLNPFDLTTSEFVRRENPIECSSHPPLTEIVFNENREESYLQIKPDSIKFYTNESTVYCCISAIQQTHIQVKLRRCDYLSNKTWILSEQFQQLIVFCYDSRRFQIYENIHATVVVTKRGKRKSKGKKNRLNVVLVGLDSMSRLNLYRTMPQTVAHLHTHGWTELRGYTKIADNTLPNLMAVLTGIPPDRLKSPHRRFFDGYPFIWKEYAAAGYVTAYAEDNARMGTFDCHLKGFFKKPTDYYLRRYFTVAETYSKYLGKKLNCLGLRSSSDHLFSYLLDFAQAHRKDPLFGLFWVNGFSHNNLNQPSSEDVQVLKTFKRLEELGTMNTTMVIFLSDHGLRVGNFRKSRIGWYEDRLPFLFVSIPEWYKTQHVKDYLNLLNNSDKLISPFDVYKTLSHVLYGDDLKDAIGCTTCYSLLTNIPSNRSCSDARVSPHWCACRDLVELPVSHSATDHRAKLVVDAINGKLNKDTDLESGYVCASLSLQSVLYYREKLNSTEYVLGIQTAPSGAQFEATIIKRGYFETVEDSISRLNEYGLESHCARNPALKLFCYCIDEETDGT